jgi:phosphatidylglycerophosphate synthase
MKQIPITLIYTRLIIGLLLIVFSILKIKHYPLIAVILLTIGLLTDIFDGIIARKLEISSERLRRLDSNIDQVFFISVALATYIQYPDFFKSNALKIIVLLAFEALTYITSYIKFKKEIATHTIGAKIWTLLLFATLIQVILKGNSIIFFELCFWIGIITRLEIIAIVLTLKNWTNDVPSIYQAIKIRKGKEIKRHKMFNG